MNLKPNRDGLERRVTENRTTKRMYAVKFQEKTGEVGQEELGNMA